MCQLPIEISATESIVRVILCPSHIKKGSSKLKPAAFRSRAGSDEVSVIRHSYMGSDFCKQKGQELDRSPVTTYSGLAIIKAKAIVDSGSLVTDSRDEYCGHAHISHGIVLEANEPPQAALSLLITERCRNLLASTTYHPDPDPSGSGWTGPLL